MPQMDFSTFFPQVFWLILLFGFFFFFLLKNFFNLSIFILKLRGNSLITSLNVFLDDYLQNLQEFKNNNKNFIKLIWINYIKNNFFFNILNFINKLNFNKNFFYLKKKINSERIFFFMKSIKIQSFSQF